MEMVATGLVAMVLGQRATALQHHVATIHQQAALAEATIRRPRRSPSHSLLRWSGLSRPPRSLILIERAAIPGILTSKRNRSETGNKKADQGIAPSQINVW